jgi:PPM family protein phosphatase
MTETTGQAASVTVTAFGITDPGKVRKNNEDAFLVARLADEGPAPSGAVTLDAAEHAVLLAVSDGMGGADAGEVASALVVQSLRDAMLGAKGNYSEATRAAVERANRDVWSAAKAPGRKGMGATLTAVCVHADHAYIAEVGDSRAYLLRNGRVRQMTRDQSFVQLLLDAGALKPEEAETYPMKNVVLQAMGQKPDVQVALGRLALRRGDRLLLCSDGLSKEVTADDMKKAVEQEKGLEAACRALVALANERGGEDNITVVLAEIDGPGVAPPREQESLTQTFQVLSEFKAAVAAVDDEGDEGDGDAEIDAPIAPKAISPEPARAVPASTPPARETAVAGVKRPSLPLVIGVSLFALAVVIVGLLSMGR